MSKHSGCVMSSPRSQAAVSSGACAIPRGGVEGPLLYRPPSSLPLVDNATGPTVVGHICRLCGANIVGLRHCHMFAKLMTIETRARAMLKISGVTLRTVRLIDESIHTCAFYMIHSTECIFRIKGAPSTCSDLRGHGCGR